MLRLSPPLSTPAVLARPRWGSRVWIPNSPAPRPRRAVYLQGSVGPNAIRPQRPASASHVAVSNPTPTHVLFDFFGTLVEYSPSRTEQGYHATHALLGTMGGSVGYEAFLDAWVDISAGLDRRSDLDDSEYSMAEVADAVLRHLLGRRPTATEISAVVDSYLAEWNTGVVYPVDTAPTIGLLAKSFGLAVVTNTHQPDLVPRHLEAMGIAHQIGIVVTSVDVGRRKPHPAIYSAALDRMGLEANDVVFVGDNYTADYLGPRAVGIPALLLDPTNRHRIPSADRLQDLAELPNRLR